MANHSNPTLTTLVLSGALAIAAPAAAETTCYETLATVPVSCSGGKITKDVMNDGGGREVTCTNDTTSDYLVVTGYGKPDNATPKTFFEAYRSSGAKTGAPIAITLGSAKVDNDMTGWARQDLPFCVTENPSLYLNGGQHKIQIEWTAPDGKTGYGEPGHFLTKDGKQNDEIGYFTFFGGDDVSVTVKAFKEFCEFSPYALFMAGGMTDVATVMTVSDTVTGFTKTYKTAPGEKFPMVAEGLPCK